MLVIVSGQSATIPWLVVNGTHNSQATFEGLAHITLNSTQPSSRPFRITVTDGSFLTPHTADNFTLIVYPDASRSQVLYQVSGNLTKGKISIK